MDQQDRTHAERPSARFDELVFVHAPKVHRLARRLTGNRADAEDLTQEVFLRAFRSIDEVDPADPAGWLHRITVNAHIDQLRRRARRADELSAEVGEGLRCSAPGPEQVVVSRRLDADLEDALAALPADARRAVLLRDVEGLSYLEVANRMGVGTDTVRSWIHRGRSRLRTALSHRAGILSG
jgi:RNA polymerase sigma factor (sigma-70 family)